MTNRRLSLGQSHYDPFNSFFNLVQQAHESAFSASNTGKSFPSYPHCNVSKLDSETNEYDIDVALAGLDKEDINVTIEPFKDGPSYAHVKILKIKALAIHEEEGKEYIHRGIKAQDANLALMISADDEVKSCEYTNGLLRIVMKRVPKDRDNVEKIAIG